MSLFVWLLPFDLSGLGDPAGSYGTAGMGVNYWKQSSQETKKWKGIIEQAETHRVVELKKKKNLQTQGGRGTNMAPVRDRKKALTDTTMNIRVPLSWGNLLARWATISL